MINSDFYIYNDKSTALLDKSTDWFLQSFKYSYGSEEWQICRLKSEILFKQATKYLKIANEALKNSI